MNRKTISIVTGVANNGYTQRKANMRNQDNENLTKELKGQMPIPQTVRKVNGTVSTLTYAVQVKRNRTSFPVNTFRISEDSKFGCLPVTGLVALGLMTVLEAHKMGFTTRA